ncbi:MAG: DinB family protein [Caldilineaceae bacterium]
MTTQEQIYFGVTRFGKSGYMASKEPIMSLDQRAIYFGVTRFGKSGYMTTKEPTMPLDPEVDLFWRKTVSAVDQLLACLDGLTETELNWRPAENTNSLFVLATHLLGNVEENIFGVLGGQAVQRDRDAEFISQGTAVEPIRQRWQTLQQRATTVLTQLSQTELTRERPHPRRGQITGREVCWVVALHAAEHRGQATLTRDLILAARAKQ